MTAGKTVPELTAETPPIVGTDELVVYRAPGPLKRATAATVRTYMLTGVATLAALAASGGSALIGFIQAGPGAVARTAQSKMRETVSVLDFGAVGDGVTNDTAACQAAIDTDKNVIFPDGYTFAITSLSGFTDNRTYSGGATIKKFGTTPAHLFNLPDQSVNITFDGLIFDGNRSAFVVGNIGSGIFGYLCRSLNVQNCTFRNIIDSGVKHRDGAFVNVTNCVFSDISENGVELRNYDGDPRTGLQYPVNARPVMEGGHNISNSRFERITREETDVGPIVDACGVTFDSIRLYALTVVPHRNITIANNTFIDCLRGIFSENNYTGSEANGVLILGNQVRSGISGGYAQGVFSKVGIGVSGVKNAVIADNIITNPVTYTPAGSVTAGIQLTASVGVANNTNVTVRDNRITNDGSIADGMEYGIYVRACDGLNISGNTIEGAVTGPIYLHPTDAIDVAVSENMGAANDQSWGNVVKYTFKKSDLPATANTDMLWEGEAGQDAAILGPSGRIVMVVARLSGGISSGSLGFKTYRSAVEETALEIVNADWGGGLTAIKKQSSQAATQVAAGAQIKVTAVSSSLSPTTIDAIVEVYVDIGMKA